MKQGSTGLAYCEHWRTVINYKKLSPLQRNTAMRAAYQCVWTGTALVERGYEVSPLCPLGCGQHDTLFRRVWTCTAPNVVEERNKVASEQLLYTARAAGEEDPLFSRGFLSLPFALAEQVDDNAARNMTVVERFDGVPNALVHNARYCFVDGSASKPLWYRWARAGRAISLFEENFKLLLVARGPVWWPLPQTSQLAEHTRVVLTQYVSSPCQVWADCSSIKTFLQQAT